ITAPGARIDGPATAEALTPTVREQLRRRRPWIVIAIALVVGAIALLVLQGGFRAPGPVLGPANAAPAGSKALVEVLRRQGVAVGEASSLDAATDLARGGATVLLYDELGILDGDALDELAAASDRLVVVEPAFDALRALAPGVRLGGVASGALDDVACDVRAAERAGELSDGQRLVTVDDEAAAEGWRGCFRDGEAFAVAAGPGPSGAELTIVAATTVFENEHVDEAGNAALAIGLLGASEELAWYLPGPADADAGSAPTLAELTPGWVSPVLVLAIVVTVVAGIRQGRRFGPLVVERLPVQVPAGETSEGRARLYARSSARGHALDQLRIGAVGRIAAVLRLPRSAPAHAVADAAAVATGRDAASVARLLIGTEPSGDRELVDLAVELDRLEHDVADSVRPAPAGTTDPGPTGPDTRPDDRPDQTGRRP
ncbi:MAG TPA: DUF4350 domain-containing protein, partial [Agromyces mariniharenae]|nr:DUF4350 domain-containing protein [Agromyces mariniharenae]